jgi:hypothetical protein
MGTLSTVAWIGHDLAVAADFGGSLFGKFGLTPGVDALESPRDRGRVMTEAWSGYKYVNLGSLLVLGGTWLAGRFLYDGWEVGKHSRQLVIAKDILVGGAVLTGIAAAVNGSLMSRDIPIDTSHQVTAAGSQRDKISHAIEKPLGFVHLAFIGGVAAVTAALAMKSGRSARWTLFSRFLP